MVMIKTGISLTPPVQVTPTQSLRKGQKHEDLEGLTCFEALYDQGVHLRDRRDFRRLVFLTDAEEERKRTSALETRLANLGINLGLDLS